LLVLPVCVVFGRVFVFNRSCEIAIELIMIASGSRRKQS